MFTHFYFYFVYFSDSKAIIGRTELSGPQGYLWVLDTEKNLIFQKCSGFFVLHTEENSAVYP